MNIHGYSRSTMQALYMLYVVVALVVGIAFIPAYAWAGSVSYEGQADGFVFGPGSSTSATDLFTNFTGVVPGDTLTDTVDVKNAGSKKVKIYMRSLGAESGSEDFLSQLTLTVVAGDSTVFDAAANQTADLTDWVLLGTLASGGATALDLTLSVPLAMNNTYQNALGTLVWEFKVEEIDESSSSSPKDPKDPKTPSSLPKKTTGVTPKTGTARTADAYPSIPFAVLAGLSVTALVYAGQRIRKD